MPFPLAERITARPRGSPHRAESSTIIVVREQRVFMLDRSIRNNNVINYLVQSVLLEMVVMRSDQLNSRAEKINA